MSVVRSFIAIELPEDIRRGLARTQDALQVRLSQAPARWVRLQNIHLTLKFLGDVSTGDIDRLGERMAVEAARHPPFEIEVGGLGAFPNTRRPRVIWVGVTAPPTLAALQRGIETEMARLGYAPEARPFSPHLTLARIVAGAGQAEVRKLSEVLDAYSPGSLGSARIASVHLFRSDLKPGGSIYTRLFSADLDLAVQP